MSEVPGNQPPVPPHAPDLPDSPNVPFDPLRELESAKQRARALREQQERDAATKQAEARQNVAEYRKLLLDRERTAEHFQLTPQEARSAETEAQQLEALVEQLQPRANALLAERVVEQLDNTTAQLAYLERARGVLQESRDSLTPEDYQAIEARTEASIAELQRRFAELEPRVLAWKAEAEALAAPVLEEFDGAAAPQNEAELTALLTRLGETLDTKHGFIAEGRELLKQLDAVDKNILELLSPPEAVSELYGAYRQEQRVRLHLTRSLRDQWNKRALYDRPLGASLLEFRNASSLDTKYSDSEIWKAEQERRARQPERFEASTPNDILTEMLVDQFIDGLSEQYDLNNPNLTVAERQRRLEELGNALGEVFRNPEQFHYAASSFNDPQSFVTQSYSSNDPRLQQRVRAQFDAFFITWLLGAGPGTPSGAAGPYVFESHFALGSYDRDGQGREQFVDQRIRPHLGMIEVMQAAQDAERDVLQKFGISPTGESFFHASIGEATRWATDTAANGSCKMLPAREFFNDKTGALLPRDIISQRDQLTPAQRKERARLEQTYQEAYNALVPLLERHVAELRELAEAKQTKLAQQIEALQVLETQIATEIEALGKRPETLREASRNFGSDVRVLARSLRDFLAQLKNAKLSLAKTSILSWQVRRDTRGTITMIEGEIPKYRQALAGVAELLNFPDKLPEDPEQLPDWGDRLYREVQYFLSGEYQETPKKRQELEGIRQQIAAIKAEKHMLERSPWLQPTGVERSQ